METLDFPFDGLVYFIFAKRRQNQAEVLFSWKKKSLRILSFSLENLSEQTRYTWLRNPNPNLNPQKKLHDLG